jgi:hypothetical protein
VDTVATTAGTGAWSKSGLKPDKYIVCEVQTANWTQSKPDPTSSPVCGPATTGAASGGGYAVTLASGEDRQNVDFGNYRDAKIEVTKYQDTNGNGQRDAGEPPLEGWQFSVGAQTASTGTDGKATFTVKPGSARTVCETLQNSWHNSQPGSDASPCYTVNATDLESGETASRSFGNYQNATLKGVKFEDNNTNGTQDAGDNGLNDWMIKAYADNGAGGGTANDGILQSGEISAGAADTATTATVNSVAGSYSLSVKPGAKYVVCEVLKSGWLQSAPSNNNCNAGATTLANGGHAVGPFTSNQSVSNLNFGNYQRGTVSGTKFEDKNSSGSQDTGEGGLGGWTIRAFADNGAGGGTANDGTLQSGETTVAGSTTTAADGTYSLTLTPGNYVICEVGQTNWVQTKPSNVRCKNQSVPPNTYAAPGGYAVNVTPGSSTTAQDFGNSHFDSGSTMTDSAFKLVDDLTPWTIDDFEILLNPKNEIVATNPGQFYYHQRATNTSGTTSSMAFSINWPCQFVTQTSGGQPIHAYVQLASDSANTWRDWTPQSSNISWTNSPTSSCDKETTAGPLGTGTITPNNVPAGAKVWVTVHLDYALKNTTATRASFGNPPILYKPFQSTAIMGGGSSYSSESLLGRGKKVTVVYGRMTHKASGNPMANVWIRIMQGTNSAMTTTDVDGNFVFFDGQQCAEDGIVKCGGVTGAWNFATGNNAASKLELLGDGPYTPPLPVAWPTAKSNGVVYSGNQTFATLTSTPSYTFNVSKNSAYDRDWKLGP